MATLYVRDVSAELYDRLKGLADREGRSLNAEVVLLLSRLADEDEMRQSRLSTLTRMYERLRATTHAEAPTSVELIRQDRSR